MTKTERHNVHQSQAMLESRLEEFMLKPTEERATWLMLGIHDHMELVKLLNGRFWKFAGEKKWKTT